MTRYRIAALALLLFAVLFARPSMAQVVVQENQEAARLIRLCWAAAEEDVKSPSDGRQRRGASKVIACLEKEILDQIPFFFPAGKPLNKVKTRRLLDQLGVVIDGLVLPMYNDNPGCKGIPRCGTLNEWMHRLTHVSFLEQILHTMITIRQQGRTW